MRQLKCRLLAAAVVLLLPAAAVAQELDLTGLHKLDDDRAELTYRGLTVEQIDDRDVFRGDTKIGEIEAVLANHRDEIAAVVIEFDDFLDLDDVEVIMPIERLEFTGRRAVTTMSDEELRALPDWHR